MNGNGNGTWAKHVITVLLGGSLSWAAWITTSVFHHEDRIDVLEHVLAVRPNRGCKCGPHCNCGDNCKCEKHR